MRKQKMLNIIAILAIMNVAYGMLVGAVWPFVIEDFTIRQTIIGLGNFITVALGYFVMKVSASSSGRNAGMLIIGQSVFYIALKIVELATLSGNGTLPTYFGVMIRIVDIAFVVPIGYLLYKEFQCKAAKLLRNGYWLSALCFLLILVVNMFDLSKEQLAVFAAVYSMLLIVPLIMRLIGWVKLREQV